MPSYTDFLYTDCPQKQNVSKTGISPIHLKLILVPQITTSCYMGDKIFISFYNLGPVHPDAGYQLVLFAEGSSPADISWTRDA